MVASYHGNDFGITGPFVRGNCRLHWSPLAQRASDAELWCFHSLKKLLTKHICYLKHHITALWWTDCWLLPLTRLGGVTHICVSEITIIGSDNGLLPGRRQAIIWTNAGILLIGTLGTNFSEILIKIYIFSFKKMYLKMSSAKWWQFCLGLNVLQGYPCG